LNLLTMAVDSLRCFVAVNLEGRPKEAVAGQVRALAAKVGGVKWVTMENLHLTLKFLGQIAVETAPRLREVLEEAVAVHPPFEVRFAGLGAFPHPARARVIWVGMCSGALEMARIQTVVEDACGRLGFQPEGRPFAPHLTIGRVKFAKNPRALADALAEAGQRDYGEMLVQGIHLMRSELFPSGPKYSILHHVRLGG
jgi:2'-5' RNA ligase